MLKKNKKIDWVKEQKKFNKENLKKPLTIKEYCSKHGLNYQTGRLNIKSTKAKQIVNKFHDKIEDEYLKKKQMQKQQRSLIMSKP
jgi:hypothetical protein